MRRNDQRLLRTAWRILRNRDDAEDAVQSAYLNAFAGIGGFAGRSTLSTWLTRIVTNAALAQARRRGQRRAWLDENPADRKRVGEGKSVSVSVGLGGRLNIKTKKI